MEATGKYVCSICGYVYDPDFQVESGSNGFAIYYGKGGTWRYVKSSYMSA